MDTNLDVPGIIKRAKQALNLKRDSELAEFLGVSRATVTNWAARNSIDFRLLLDKLGNTVDYNWLLLGKGNPKHQSRFCESELAQGEVQIIHNPKTAEPVDDRSVTLYDITAAANLKTLFTNKHQYALGKIRIPNISACDGAVYVNGDSMYPILKSGDIIGYKEINSFENVIYGEIYLVSFMIDGDEYLAVKYANRSEKEGCIKLVSYNTHHEPMDIPFAAINAMAIVKFSIRRHMMMSFGRCIRTGRYLCALSAVKERRCIIYRRFGRTRSAYHDPRQKRRNHSAGCGRPLPYADKEIIRRIRHLLRCV